MCCVDRLKSQSTAELGRFHLKAQFIPELKFCFQPTAYILANPYLAKVRMTWCDARHAFFIEPDQRMLSSVEDWNRANPFSITAWGNSQINLWWNMSCQSHLHTALGRTLGILLLLLGTAGAGMSAAADASSWKIPPDPEIINFKRADATVVTQTLVAPPFLPKHEQVANGQPWTVFVGGRRGGRALPQQEFRVIDIPEFAQLSEFMEEIEVFGLDPMSDGLFLTVVAFRDLELFYDAGEAMAGIEGQGEMSADMYLLKGEILNVLGREAEARAAFDKADALMR